MVGMARRGDRLRTGITEYALITAVVGSGCGAGLIGDVAERGAPQLPEAAPSPNGPLAGPVASGHPGTGTQWTEVPAAGNEYPVDVGVSPDSGASTPDAGAPADAGTPAVDAGAPVPPPPSGTPALDLGRLPVAVAWPASAVVARTVDVYDMPAANQAAATPGTRLRVHSDLSGQLTIAASDVVVEVDAGVFVERAYIARSVQRIRIVGGRYASIEISRPAISWPAPEMNPDWFAEDILIDSVRVEAGLSAFVLRGRRVAVVRSTTDATNYSVWMGDTAPFQSEDVILAHNHFVSAGPESTVRLVDVLRSAVVGNRMENTTKHNYRLHGQSGENYAAENELVTSGIMFGTMPGDQLGRVWFDRNIFYHTTPDLFSVSESALSALNAHENHAYTNVWNCLYCGEPPAAWSISDNAVSPYRPAP